MKKINLLIPSLLTIGLAPMISMVSCTEKEPEPEDLEGTPIELEYDGLDYNSYDNTLTSGKKYVAIIDLTEIKPIEWIEAQGEGWNFKVSNEDGLYSGHVDKISIDGKIYYENDGYKTTIPNMLRIESMSSTSMDKSYKLLEIQFTPSVNTVDAYLRMEIGTYN